MYPERMLRNLDASFGLVFSQPVLLALVEAGASRDDAYRIVQRNAMRAWQEERSFRELLAADPDVRAVARRRRGSTRASTSSARSPTSSRVFDALDAHRATCRRERSATALPHLYSGKVRELYEVGHDRLLMVASDRISVFDVVLPDEIPDKGRVLTGAVALLVRADAPTSSPNHVISCDPTDFPETAGDVAGRAMLVQATRPIRLECVVRGYLFGGGWSEYPEQGTVGGFAVPAGLQQAEQLPEPLFTPTTKAESGHDLPLTRRRGGRARRRRRVRAAARPLAAALRARRRARARAAASILADTKFEFGELDGEIIVIDEMMTPDSSRYWPRRRRTGRDVAAVVRQAVRARLHGQHRLGPRAARAAHARRRDRRTRARKYLEAYELLTGRELSTTGTARTTSDRVGSI